MERPANLDPRRTWMPEEETERLNKAEFEAVRCLLGAVNYVAHAKDDISKRIKMIPHGQQRLNLALGAIRALTDDVIGTIPVGQCRQLKNTMNDMDMRMVPKYTSMNQNVILEKELARGLFDAAMEKCRGCVEDEQSCRKCALYKVLEGTLPLTNYDGMICPYSISEWID